MTTYCKTSKVSVISKGDMLTRFERTKPEITMHSTCHTLFSLNRSRHTAIKINQKFTCYIALSDIMHSLLCTVMIFSIVTQKLYERIIHTGSVKKPNAMVE